VQSHREKGYTASASWDYNITKSKIIGEILLILLLNFLQMSPYWFEGLL